ncbi:MAG TPA: HAD family hydrolase [Longimicrobiaceae bacterium]|nr:HAD family hydrolase [Longimicrobiaceae bacterium]
MARVRAVILDIDGTLIDSNDAHARAFLDAAGELGLEVPPFEEVRRRIGMGGDKLIPEVWGFSKESQRGETLDGRKGEIFRERYLPGLEPTRGARALLHRLRDDGVKLVVATSAGKDDVKGLLERAGVADLVQDATSADEVEESKPDPDIVHAALKDAGFPAEQTVMLGDTPYDVEAATRAGVPVVAVRCGGWGDGDLRGAAAVYDHPADLLEHYDESPVGRGDGGG